MVLCNISPMIFNFFQRKRERERDKVGGGGGGEGGMKGGRESKHLPAFKY